MSVRRNLDTKKTEEIINRGAKTISETTEDEDLRFTLRIPKALIDEIDTKRKTKIGKISRNQWILQAIVDKLEA